MFGLSGVRCGICGMALENEKFSKDERGDVLYWANPKLSAYTDVRIDFCGVMHSFEWHQKKIEASKNVTPDTDQAAD
jgi:hypothetical protein